MVDLNVGVGQYGSGGLARGRGRGWGGGLWALESCKKLKGVRWGSTRGRRMGDKVGWGESSRDKSFEVRVLGDGGLIWVEWGRVGVREWS